MEKFTSFIFICFFSLIVCGQQKDSAGKLFSMLSEKAQKQALIIQRLSDYSYIEGNQFGKFCSKDTTGRIILTNDSLKGKVVFVNFWFESCKYCHNLFEPLNQLSAHYKDNPYFRLISFTFDLPEVLEKNSTKYGLKYPVLYLEDSACHSLLIDKGFPANFLLDKTGKIVLGTGVSKFLANPKFFDEEIIPRIDSLLKQN